MSLLMLGGCTTVNLEDAFPTTAQTQPQPQPDSGAAAQPALSAPGQYPNLNVIPVPSGPQLTPAETRSTASDLRAKRTQQDAGAGQQSAGANPEELRRLADTHAEETLRAIEGD